MFLSFIIPVYNAEKYIAQCIDSLLAQDLSPEDFEIVCVNDGSKDSSLSILEQYEKNHSNIHVINKENGGVTTARNAGLAAAQGEFIWFVDADDLVKENILGKLRAMVPDTGCDRIVFGAYEFMDAMTDEELEKARNAQLVTNTSWYDAVVWRSLLRREFLLEHNLNFRYPELTHGEDGLFMYEITLASPTTVSTEEVLYFYRVHSGSADNNVNLESQRRKVRSHIRITQILQDYYLAASRPNEAAVDKLMVFLWKSLYEITLLPAQEARSSVQQMQDSGLFPYRRPAECTIRDSYMTSRTGLVGKVFNFVYLHLHTPWGYFAMRLMQKLR